MNWTWLILLVFAAVRADPCGNCGDNGECVRNFTNPGMFYCRCKRGYSGDKCDVFDYCENSGFASTGINPCANGGKCEHTPEGFVCHCKDVFTGHRCEEDVDECQQEGLCQNGAKCENKFGSFECLCNNGFSGKYCEINTDDCADNPCQNNATCMDGADTYSCVCRKGFYGPICEHKDECYHNNPCQHGTCRLNSEGKAECKCPLEFEGDHCEKDVDECEYTPCGERGRCENQFGSYKCHCHPGFEGDRCEKNIDYCKVDHCQNGGSCISQKDRYLCVCVVGFSGEHCEYRDDKNCKLPCQNGGLCLNSTHCECANSFKGQFCEEEKPDPCAGKPCENDGVCLTTDDYESFTCNCPTSHTGKFCEFEICNPGEECKMRPYFCGDDKCLNGGTCVSLKHGYKCHCQNRFLGTRCELQNSTSVKISATSDDTDKKGQVIVYLVGDWELVRRHINEILNTMQNTVNVDMKLALDGDNKAMVYEWDSVNGPGKRIDLKPESEDQRELEQDPEVVRGVFMVLKVDTTQCKSEDDSCPKNLVEASKALMSASTQKALKPLGISVKEAEGPHEKEQSSKTFWFSLIVGAGLLSLLIISVLNVVTNFNKNQKDPFTGLFKKGSLIYKANSKRNAKTFSASTFIPPLEKPLIQPTQPYDYLQNPSYMQFGGPFGHQNYGMLPTTSLLQEKAKVIMADETKLLPERASSESDIHFWVQKTGVISELPEGAEINKPDHVCRTALHWLVEIKLENESIHDVEFLYHKGADLNAVDMAGDTPLMLAVKNWRNAVVLRLLELGANPTITNSLGQNALHLAVQTGNEPAVAELLKFPTMQLDQGTLDEEDTPLKLAAKHGDVYYGIALRLIEAGAQIDATGDANKSNGLKRTPLHAATLSAAEKIMTLLLKNGAQVDAKDSNLQTPLHLAARNKHLDSLKLLLKWNANRSFEDIDGNTPLLLAEQHLFDIGVRELIGASASSSPESIESEKKASPMKKTQKRKATALESSKTAPAVPSTMLSPSSERCTPPHNGTISVAQHGASHPQHGSTLSLHGTALPPHGTLYPTIFGFPPVPPTQHQLMKLSPQDLQRPYFDSYSSKWLQSCPSTNSSNYSSQSDSPDSSHQAPVFDMFVEKKQPQPQIGHFMI
ncbi:unnamed protein product [Bursaphelenchus okinawaensis]|uniref:EGF-like domain-containing protein n=1 Tax=Bursaphelenchus okinawaensis TaxID=465554 RepID=A0A811KCX1_9BILA|nr:unnamed protein product [Bursaphelenchus okinawaensis]CAG9098989.1 unnamed protein product [Bursaphelenchus okinawaensis]